MAKHSIENQNSTLSLLLYLIIATGIFLAIYQFIFNRSLWLDEAMLAHNIISKDFLELLKPLDRMQAAPIGFLFVEKLSVLTFGKNEIALRLFPLISFLFTIPFFYLLSKKLTSNNIIALISTSFFTISLAILRYSSEVKQYPIDILFSMMILYFTLTLQFNKNKSLLIYAILGGTAIWFSNASVIILAVVGLYLLYSESYKNKNYKILLPFLFWLISFSIYYYFFVYNHPMTEFMKTVWSWAFIPLNPFSKDFYIFFYKSAITIYHLWGFPSYSVFIPMTISLGTIIFIIKSQKYTLLYFLLSPLILHLLLSGFEIYPFTGRFLLYTLPLIVLLYSYGLYYLFYFINNKIVKLNILLLLLPVLIMFYSIYLHFPIEIEETKKSLSYIEKNIKKDETVYIYYGANDAYIFYKDSNIIDINNTIITGIPFKFKGKERKINNVIMTGTSFEFKEKSRNNDDILLDLTGKVWLLFSHVYPSNTADNEEKYIVDFLLERGSKLIEVKKYKGSSVYYIDTKKSN